MATIPPEYLKMSDQELYLELASALTGGHAAPQDSDEAERVGFNYFRESLPDIRAAVCGSAGVASLIKKDDAFAVASVIAELISTHFKLPGAIATLAVLSARMGLRSLCPEVKV